MRAPTEQQEKYAAAVRRIFETGGERFDNVTDGDVDAFVYLIEAMVQEWKEAILPVAEAHSVALGKIADGVPGCDAEYIAREALGRVE